MIPRRYEEFYSNPETSSIAKHLIKRPHGQDNCALLSSQVGKPIQRKEAPRIALSTPPKLQYFIHTMRKLRSQTEGFWRSQDWKTRTRYEIQIGLNATGDAPIWVAPVMVELMSTMPPGMTDGKILSPFGNDIQWLLTSVRGPKTGSVCQDVSGSAPKQSASECDAGSGHVWSPNGKVKSPKNCFRYFCKKF